MGYTTISRRVIMAKVKTKPNQRHMKPVASRTNLSERSAIPVLFNRSTPRLAPIALPVSWWSDWKAIALTIGLILALLCAVYFAATSGVTDKRTASRTRQEILKPPPEINVRPMGYVSSPRSSAGESSQSSAVASVGSPGFHGGSVGDVSKRRSGAEQSSEINDLSLAMLEQNRKLILPSDVAGSCNIGNNGISDLSSCLVRNGARVDR